MMIPASQETSYATPYVNLVFGPQTLFSPLYLSTQHRPDAGPTAPESWTIGSALVPLYLPAAPHAEARYPPADRRRTAIYSVSAGGGRAYVGGLWNADSSQHFGQREAVRLLPPLRRPQGPRRAGCWAGRAANCCSESATICRAWPRISC
ncbi:MAG: hypothetical protein WKG07_00930 [Hymenobacter sp.]